MADMKRGYLAVRKLVDTLNAEAQQHLEAYQELITLHGQGSPRGTLALWAGVKNPTKDQPSDVVALQVLPADFLREIVGTLLEYHKIALQEADRKMAELSRELVELHNQARTPAPPAPVQDGIPQALSEKVQAFVGAEDT